MTLTPCRHNARMDQDRENPRTRTTTDPSVLVRGILLVFAIFNLALGIVGIFVPGLPTTVFILLAAWAAAKSSPPFTDGCGIIGCSAQCFKKLGQWRLRQPQGQMDSFSSDVIERGHPVVQQRTSLGNCYSHCLHDHCLGLVVAPT